MPLQARVRVSKGSYEIPLAKLRISGKLEDLGEKQVKKATQRAIIFVIDRSGSMAGSRITTVRSALIPFTTLICEDPNVVISVVLFCHEAQSFDVPKNESEAKSVLETNLTATGGTDFLVASRELVRKSEQILKTYPTHQLSVIMCSDGEVEKGNAQQAHRLWKEFVTAKYVQVHGTVPFVESIGISEGHDADVLDGFICNDSSGNYSRCTTTEKISEAFTHAGGDALLRLSNKITVSFPFNAFNDIYAKQKFKLLDIVTGGDEFSQDFWISAEDVRVTAGGTTKGDDKEDKEAEELIVMIEQHRVPIKVDIVTDSQECQNEAIAYYQRMIQDMLHALRNVSDPTKLKESAIAIESELKTYESRIEKVTQEPAQKQELTEKLRSLMDVVTPEARQERAELMQTYKRLNNAWREHRKLLVEFSTTHNALKQLLRDIQVGTVRVQEIRQHILDLHFRKTHAKRMDRLILSEEQLEKRQEMYDQIEPPTEEEVQDVTDELGTGCYLSTLTRREVVLDADPLWMCGRVKREGGAAVSNPELIIVQYISPDLVSESYFRMALEAKPEGFSDSSRETVNCRLFPIYANKAHLTSSKPYVHEGLAHTLSGRVDIRVVDYGCLYAVLGHMIAKEPLSHKNLSRVFDDMLPSMELFSKCTFSKPYKELHNREPDINGARIPIAELSRQRLQRYNEHVKCRTTALVSCATVLFADKLLSIDVELTKDFWFGLVLQKLRQVTRGQIPREMDRADEAKEVEKKHLKVLQTIIRGSESEWTDEKTTESSSSNTLDLTYSSNHFYSSFRLPPQIQNEHVDPTSMATWNATHITSTQLEMCGQFLGKIDISDIIQANHFFRVLEDLQDCTDLEKHYNEFKLDTPANDIKVLFKALGMKLDFNIVRALCGIALFAPSNQKYQSNLAMFDGDMLLNKPDAILDALHNIVVGNIKYEHEVWLENKRLQELQEIHSNPVLPDIVDELGNLPYLKCAWSRCGKEFDNRDKLLDHVKRCITHPFVHRFHLHCRSVLDATPNIDFDSFCKQVREKFGEDKSKLIDNPELECYYKQFQPIVKKLTK